MMKLFLIYQAEVAICIGAFYVFYKLLLSKDVSHQLKRGYIIFTGTLAHIIPALTFNISLSGTSSTTPIAYISQITEQFATIVPAVQPVNTTSPWHILLWIWGLGLAVMLLRLIVSLYNVNRILNEATTVPNYPFKICGAEMLSFSFFKAIVLNTRHFQSPALKYILAHEQTHARQFHTVDILFIEMIKTMQWFNPFAWLFAKETALNLEYIADDQVISQYDDARAYQLAIVQLSQPTRGKLLRTEFSKSNLKNRIEMMNQVNNNRRLGWQYLLVLPLVALLLSSFSIKIKNLDIGKEIAEILPLTALVGENILEEIPLIQDLPNLKEEKNNLVELNKKEAPVVHPSTSIRNNEVQTKRYEGSIELSPNPLDALPTMLASIGDQDTTRIIRGRVISKDGSPAPGVNVIVKGTSTGTVTNKEGEFAISVGNSYDELVIASPDNHVEVVDISQGDDFEITLKSDLTVNVLPLDRSAYINLVDSTRVVDTGDSQPLYILDEEEVSNDILKTIDPNDIDNITVLKGKGATKLYGDKAKDGVIIIKTKKKYRKKGK
jgi:bla regulator protein blaR1